MYYNIQNIVLKCIFANINISERSIHHSVETIFSQFIDLELCIYKKTHLYKSIWTKHKVWQKWVHLQSNFKCENSALSLALENVWTKTVVRHFHNTCYIPISLMIPYISFIDLLYNLLMHLNSNIFSTPASSGWPQALSYVTLRV